jgi:hypothetical protein
MKFVTFHQFIQVYTIAGNVPTRLSLSCFKIAGPFFQCS